MTAVWTSILVVAVANFAIKAAGPVLLGGRELPRPVVAVIAPPRSGAPHGPRRRRDVQRRQQPASTPRRPEWRSRAERFSSGCRCSRGLRSARSLLHSSDSPRRRILPAMSDYDPVAFDAFEAAGWGTKEAAGYDALAGRVTSHLADPLLDAVGAGPGKRVLDIATGRATSRPRLPSGARSPSASTSPRRCSRSRAHARRVSSSCVATRPSCRSRRTPSMRRPAHFCFCISAGRRQPQPRPPACSHLGAVLRSAFGTSRRRGRWLGVVFDAFTAAGVSPPADVPHGPPIFRFADDGEFTRLLADAGLTDVAIKRVGFTSS